MTIRVLTLVGSLRAGSHNRQFAEAAAAHAPEGVTVEIHDGLGELPFYNEDLDTETGAPEQAQRLRQATLAADAVLLLTPEYNGTMPAVLKNAIDWISRPYGAGALKGKPAVVAGTAFGRYGGVWAQEEARKAARVAGANVVDELLLAVPFSHTRFAETHPKADTEVVEGLTKALSRLAAEC
ncbi:NAD(P)H-dependent oxidoreductase [Saccharomonospora sp. NB11]|jgi:NAD(P)H-dependent FMN reductase|uniref:NAD(P)H-dependent oxidoreductase n=1 Tax=Saccharomonospora sp. NB11 TaxID=1642298 RepID=UPI0018D14C89|nr:NAD(P)H-dependent oxidoreductase [Saccharomonospora sp. NB11]